MKTLHFVLPIMNLFSNHIVIDNITMKEVTAQRCTNNKKRKKYD